MYCEVSAGKVDLLAQITELQEAVAGMKGSLTEAVSRLSAVADDPAVASEVAAKMSPGKTDQHLLLQQQEKCDANTAEVLKLVLALKGDVTTLKKDVSTISERQDGLQRTLDNLIEDRRTDAIHRSRGIGGPSAPHGEGRSSGSHSNDSGVALLLERAHQAFHADRTSPSTMLRTSDQDSLPEQPSLLVPPLVYDYVAALTQHPPHNGLGPMEQEELAYDSDSSLTLAAAKSISLSANISKEMTAGMAYADTSSCEGPQHSGAKARVPDCRPDMSRTDSDGSDQSRDTHHARRRRYEKGSSCSTGKLYGTLGRSGSQEHATYQALSAFGPLTTHGLYSHTTHYPHYNNTGHHHYSHYTHHRNSKDSHRCRVARELLETEKKYCRTLWIIQDTFAEPLKKSGILSQKDINTLFPVCVYQLYDKHCHLQHQLRERLASWQWQPLVGDILAKFTDTHQSDVLRLYTSYVNDFPEVLKTFHKLCRSSPSFTKFIKTCLEQPSCGGLDLGAFLLTPVQRIPRYILLLKQLLKYTDETHPDFHHVNVCLDRLKDFLERLNDSIEHSFQLVHATFSPGSLTDPALAVTVRNGRISRSPRRTRSTVESPTYSPERPPSTQEEPTSARTSPKRSISIAGGNGKVLVVSKRRPKSSDAAGRSRSLPRAVLPLSPEDDDVSPSSSPHRRRGNIQAAKSVADITQDNRPVVVDGEPAAEKQQLWEELAGSEPAKLDAQQQQKRNSKVSSSHTHHVLSSTTEATKNNLNAAHSSTNLKQEGQRLQTWTDVQEALQEDGTAKKKSIKSSLKNMFTFKKRSAASPSGPRPSQQQPHLHHHHHPHDHLHHHHHTAHHHPPRPQTSRGMREESDYWDPQTQHLLQQQQQLMTEDAAIAAQLQKQQTAQQQMQQQTAQQQMQQQNAQQQIQQQTAQQQMQLQTAQQQMQQQTGQQQTAQQKMQQQTAQQQMQQQHISQQQQDLECVQSPSSSCLPQSQSASAHLLQLSAGPLSSTTSHHLLQQSQSSSALQTLAQKQLQQQMMISSSNSSNTSPAYSSVLVSRGTDISNCSANVNTNANGIVSASSHYQTLASMIPSPSLHIQASIVQPPSHPPTPLHHPTPPSTPVPGQQVMSIVGDFVDEDGNPCSNV